MNKNLPIRTIVNADVLTVIHKLSIAWLIRQHVEDEFNENVWTNVKRPIARVMWHDVAEPVYNNVDKCVISYQQ